MMEAGKNGYQDLNALGPNNLFSVPHFPLITPSRPVPVLIQMVTVQKVYWSHNMDSVKRFNIDYYGKSLAI